MTKIEDKIVKQLLDIISETKLTQNELVLVIATFLFSIGATLDGCRVLAAEEILIKYAKNPTLGSALMAQALMMKETWIVKEKEVNKHGTENI